MSRTTQREVWEWLQENGPVDLDDLRNEFGEGVPAVVRNLRKSGHVSWTLDFKVKANDTDELRPLVGPFGAGAGIVEGEEPPRKP